MALIDHFSSLPNELLQQIFDLAYPDQSSGRPHPFPLSSRLRPFLENVLYFEIHIKYDDLAKRLLLLSKTLSDRPKLGEKVIRLELADWHEEDDYKLAVETALGIRKLLRLLPNLRHFVYKTSLPYVPFFPNRHSSLHHLTHISLFTPFNIENKTIDLDELEWMSALPALTSLNLTEWWIELHCSPSHDVLLPQIKCLTIEGDGAAEPAVANLVNACPGLVKLKLDSSYSYDFGLTLPLLQSTIESLCLCSSSESERLEGDSGIDNHLSHFTHLTTLELPYGVTSSRTPVALLDLPHLVYLILGNSDVEVSALHPLVEGQHRLLHLRRITLNDEDFDIDRRFDPADEYLKNPFLESHDFPLLRWTQYPYSDPSQRWRDLIEFELLGRRNGVIIEGTAGAKQGLRNYALEKYNLAIAQIYYHSDFSYVYDALKLAALHDVQVPPIGIDLFNGNSDEVELVKVEMKGYGWFALSVRKKE